MDYSKIQTEHYRLHLIKTTKFKKNSIKLCFRIPITDKIDGLKRDILCNLLVLGTKKYASQRELEIKCEDLFGANLSFNNSKTGNYYIFTATITILSDQYTLENTTRDAIQFLEEVLFNPKIENGLFDETLVEKAKKMYIDSVKSIQDNPSQFAVLKARYHTNLDSIYAFNPYFFIKEIENITSKELVESYQKLLTESSTDIALIGNIDDTILSLFESLPIQNKEYQESPFASIQSIKEQKIEEEGKYNQSKLVITCHLEDLTDFERQYVSYVYSFILGGSSDSLIFKKLRQDNSLCYYADSSYLFLYQMLEINVGLESKNMDMAVSLVKEALHELATGNFALEEIEKAKVTYTTAWKEILDNPGSIVNMYLSHEYYELDYAEKRIQMIQKVTKEDIMNVAKKLSISTIYLLKGDSEND